MAEPDEMTIDELARAADVVVSTVRLYQTKRLLPPPARRGRVGYYGQTHLGRLRLIAQLQERGFSLAAIKELLDGMDHGESLTALLGLGDRPSTWVREPSRRISLAELAEHLPQVELDATMVQRIKDLGLVDFPGESQDVVVHTPSLLQIGGALAALGLPHDVILDEYEALLADTQRIAERFTALFRAHLWEPFVEAGMPGERIAQLIGALENLGPLAEAVVVAALREALQTAAESFVQTEAGRLGVDIPRPGRE